MSIREVESFNYIAEIDQEIRDSLEKTTDDTSLMELTVKLAAERGFIFTVKNLERYYDIEIERALRKRSGSFGRKGFADRGKMFDVDRSLCWDLPYLAREICQKRNS
ncbi:MAG: hypothetical protein RPG89_18200 [Microcystis panniformis WG22]|nr:hypothetical protein [Microcystis panniformis WG22]